MKIITDIFYQGAQEGIPAHWCVQYYTSASVFVDYEYFEKYEQALEWAKENGWDE